MLKHDAVGFNGSLRCQSTTLRGFRAAVVEDKFLDVSVIMRLLGAPKLVFLCNSLEGLGRTFNSIGQPAVVFDRKLADDLVYASRSVISELRLVIYVLTGRIFMAHVRPLAFSFCAEEPA